MKHKKSSAAIENRRAYHDYFVEDTLECGISLRGNEVKSIRAGMCSIKESWCKVQDGNLIVTGMHVTRYDTANLFDVSEKRDRQLLAHKREIAKCADYIRQTGYAVVPLKVYFDHRRCKVLIGFCKGKREYDKRESLKAKQAKREMERRFSDG